MSINYFSFILEFLFFSLFLEDDVRHLRVVLNYRCWTVLHVCFNLVPSLSYPSPFPQVMHIFKSAECCFRLRGEGRTELVWVDIGTVTSIHCRIKQILIEFSILIDLPYNMLVTKW